MRRISLRQRKEKYAALARKQGVLKSTVRAMQMGSYAKDATARTAIIQKTTRIIFY